MDKVKANAQEILPSLLYWAPGLDTFLQDEEILMAKSHSTYVNALEIGQSNGKVAEYYVPHYNKFGSAFGPFALDVVLQFCRSLKLRLECHVKHSEKSPLCLTTPQNEQAYSNAAVLLGAYLIFCERWSATRVAEVLGKVDAEREFPRSWDEVRCSDTYLTRVRHCWEGLEAAREHTWVDLNCLNDAMLFEETCAKYRKMAFTYDSAWLVFGKILVSSDPVTTMCDPNPETFSDLWGKPQGNMTGYGTPSTAETSEAASSPDIIDIDTGDATVSTASTKVTLLHMLPSKSNSIITPFTSFAQECGVSQVIRTNFREERGMPQPSYDETRWRTYGIEHIDLPFVDGTVPPPAVVANALYSHQNMRDANPDAVLVHCKSGFGRSVTLACCLVIHDYDIPGSALLGWARICRPGSICTVAQEKYLLSLKGRVDVSDYAARSKAKNSCEPGAKVSCGCVLQ